MWLWFGNLLDVVRGAIDYIISGLMYWVMQIWKRIYNALVGFWNWILGGLEFIYNVIRPHLVNLLTVWFSFFGIKRMIFSETMSLRNKVIGIIATPFLSWFGSMILASFLPTTIYLPKASPLPEDIVLDENAPHQPLVEDYTQLYPRISESIPHTQVIDEVVNIYYGVREDYVHVQAIDETIVYRARIVGVSEDKLHLQAIDESVYIGLRTISVSEDYVHVQAIDEAVSIKTIITISEDSLHAQAIDETVVIG
jgi:hypothetical protein